VDWESSLNATDDVDEAVNNMRVDWVYLWKEC
jgi:hypothetical protein